MGESSRALGYGQDKYIFDRDEFFTGTILDDDTTITLALSSPSVKEDGASNLSYTFTRAGLTANPLTVFYTIDASGTATLGSDYVITGDNTPSASASSRSITFQANASTATVNIDPTADLIVEPDETVALKLAPGSGYTIGTTNPVKGTIANDDTQSSEILISTSNLTVREDSKQSLQIKLSRSQINSDLTVYYLLGGSADLYSPADSTGDYTISNGKTIATFWSKDLPYRRNYVRSIEFKSGNDTTEIAITPTWDLKQEGAEDLTLQILDQAELLKLLPNQAPAVNYSIKSNAIARATITDDDIETTGQYTLKTGEYNLARASRSFGSSLIGNELDNMIWGGTDRDMLDGKGGNDWLVGNGATDSDFFYRSTKPTSFELSEAPAALDFNKLNAKPYISRNAFGIGKDDRVTLKVVADHAGLMTASNSSSLFVYDKRNGALYYSQNKSQNGWGDGGVMARIMNMNLFSTPIGDWSSSQADLMIHRLLPTGCTTTKTPRTSSFTSVIKANNHMARGKYRFTTSSFLMNRQGHNPLERHPSLGNAEPETALLRAP